MSPALCELVIVRDPQSVTTGAVQLTVASQELPADTITSAQPEICGAVLSSTTTANEHVEILPAASVAVYVTVLDPRENTDPEAIVLVNVTGPAQLSETVGVVQLTVAWHEAFAPTVMVEGHAENRGLVIS